MFNEHHWCQTLGAVRFIVILRNSSDIIQSEARFLLVLTESECMDMASGHISHVLLNFRPCSSQWLRPHRLVQKHHKSWAPPRWSCKAYKLYGSAGLCSPGQSIFARPKMMAPSCPKAVHPFADGNDVATRGLTIGLFLASLLQDWRHMHATQALGSTPLSRDLRVHCIYTY
jgi:hypothetical protein